jgi:hypothetical protein
VTQQVAYFIFNERASREQQADVGWMCVERWEQARMRLSGRREWGIV